MVIKKDEFNLRIGIGERIFFVLNTDGIDRPRLSGGNRKALPLGIAHRRAVLLSIKGQQIGSIRIALCQYAFVRFSTHNRHRRAKRRQTGRARE